MLTEYGLLSSFDKKLCDPSKYRSSRKVLIQPGRLVRKAAVV